MATMPGAGTRARRDDRGFTLVELLVTMAITTVILGATMLALSDATRAADMASQVTQLNNGLRTAMDLMVRDLLQVGQGLPSGRAILIPNGSNSQTIRLPSPPGQNYVLDGAAYCPPRPPDDIDTVCEDVNAVIPGAGRGPILIAGEGASDMITTLAADSAFEQVRLRQFATDGLSILVPLPGTTPPQDLSGHNISDTPDLGGDNIYPGDLIMLTKGTASALVQVTSVSGQTIFFASGDSMRLNQTNAADGTAKELRAMAPTDNNPVAPNYFVYTVATRIRMVTYYVDAATDPLHPRLVRRINNNPATAVAFDIETLQFSYDLADGLVNPANVRMDGDDLDGSGECSPDPCYANAIRKVNITLGARSRNPKKGTNQFYRNRLVTQVSLRSLAFVDRYR
jgi:prepilin-type N-terminal cleavage/methylation domain-containing protein